MVTKHFILSGSMCTSACGLQIDDKRKQTHHAENVTCIPCMEAIITNAFALRNQS